MNKKETVINENNNELSYDTKTLITVICLVAVYPVGLILMFAWMKWGGWLKFLIALPLVLIGIVFIILLMIPGLIFMKMGENLTRPETIKEIREVIEATPTEAATKSGQGIINPTIKPMVTKTIRQ